MGIGRPAGPRRSAGSRLSATSSAARLHQVLDVPIGLINDAWGGSACEAWIRRDILAADEKYAPMLKRWGKLEKDYDDWKAAVAKAKADGKPISPRPRQSRATHARELSAG